MAFTINILPSTEKYLRKISPELHFTIRDAIRGLAVNPRPKCSKILINFPKYHIRIGDYRILYKIDDTHKVIITTDIGHRWDIYR